MTIVDSRVAKPVMKCEINKGRGVPTCLKKIRDTTTNMVSTYRGYLLSHELRANLFTSIRKLENDQKPLPI
jgi:hypothetical protein